MVGGAVDAVRTPDLLRRISNSSRDFEKGMGGYQTLLETSRRRGEHAVIGGEVLAHNNDDLRDEWCNGPQRHPHLLSELMEHGRVSWESGSRRKSSKSGNFAAAYTKSSLHLPPNGPGRTEVAEKDQRYE